MREVDGVELRLAPANMLGLKKTTSSKGLIKALHISFDIP